MVWVTRMIWEVCCILNPMATKGTLMTLPADPWYGHRMADDDTERFLNEQATGVLSLADEGQAYGVPMSFAYDAANGRLLMDMGFGDASKKRAFIEETDSACLTTYEWNDPTDWTSVIVTGSLSRLSADEVDDSTASWYQQIATDIDIAGGVAELIWYELTIEDLTGVAVYER